MKTLTILYLVFFTTAIQAGAFRCVNGSIERLVVLDYPGQKHLCEVAVTDQDGLREVKWFADNDSGFCSEKIDELVGKYQGQWGYTCEVATHTTDLSTLPLRYRKIVDNIVRDASTEGETATIPFTVTATRVRTTKLEASSINALLIQLFMTAVDESITTPVDRTYFIEDDGAQFRTKSVWSGLRHKIALDDDTYRIDSAVINEINSKGEIEIETVLNLINSDNKPVQNCKGSQLLLTTENGDLTAVGQHIYSCN